MHLSEACLSLARTLGTGKSAIRFLGAQGLCRVHLRLPALLAACRWMPHFCLFSRRTCVVVLSQGLPLSVHCVSAGLSASVWLSVVRSRPRLQPPREVAGQPVCPRAVPTDGRLWRLAGVLGPVRRGQPCSAALHSGHGDPLQPVRPGVRSRVSLFHRAEMRAFPAPRAGSRLASARSLAH